MFRFVGAVQGDTDVVRLGLCQGREFGAKLAEVQAGDFFVQLFREAVHADVQFLVPQLNLRQRLVREAVGHHETRVACRATEVDEPPLCQQVNAMTVREDILVHLRLDVHMPDARPCFQLRHLYLVVEMPDVAHNRLIAHPAHVFRRDDVTVARRRHIDIRIRQRVLDCRHLVPRHAGL